MSIADKLQQILSTKIAIKSAIQEKKGGAVSGGFTSYPEEIQALSTGGEIPTVGWSEIASGDEVEADGWIKYVISTSSVFDGTQIHKTITVGSKTYTPVSLFFDNPMASEALDVSGTIQGYYPCKGGDTISCTPYAGTCVLYYKRS